MRRAASTRLVALIVYVAGAAATAVGARATLAQAVPDRPPRPQSQVAQLAAARQLLLVTTPDWNRVAGRLRPFTRPSAAASWSAARVPGVGPDGVEIVVGKNGTAWDPGVVAPIAGPLKAEGDGRSPAGVFALGGAFGFSPASGARWVKLPYTEVTPTTECVDDPRSSAYNRIVDRAVSDATWRSSEKMREVSPGYHWGVVVEYNTRPVVPQRGSCIFLHVGGEGGRGTAGCTAMAEPQLRAVMQWLDPKAAPVLVQLPSAAYDALRVAWGLPEL